MCYFVACIDHDHEPLRFSTPFTVRQAVTSLDLEVTCTYLGNTLESRERERERERELLQKKVVIQFKCSASFLC